MSEKFCLRWNDFENNISVAFKDLREEKDFFDVSLACDSDEQISAHKVILSACSPWFRAILKRNPHQHPLLYLKGVKHSDLQAVLNFMYHGEVNVAQEELNSFLSVAEELHIKGLTQGAGDGGGKNAAQQNNLTSTTRNAGQSRSATAVTSYESAAQPKPSARQVSQPAVRHSPVVEEVGEVEEIQSVVKTEPAAAAVAHSQYDTSQAVAAVENQTVVYQEDHYEDYDQYDDQNYDGALVDPTQGMEGDKGTIEIQGPSDLFQFVKENLEAGSKRYSCSLCEGFFHNGRAQVRNHVESKHYGTSFKYTCEFCEKQFSSKNSYQMHKSRSHRPVAQNWNL